MGGLGATRLRRDGLDLHRHLRGGDGHRAGWQGRGAPGVTQHAHVQQLRLVRANRPFVLLAASYGLQACGQEAFAASLPDFIAHVLQRPPQTAGVFFLCVTATALIVLTPWIMARRRLSKRTAYLWASDLYASASLLALTYTSTTDVAVMLLGFVVLGIGFGGMELFSHAMLPDAAEEARAHSGMNREAPFSGVWIATEKLGFALGAGVVAALLHWVHYEVAGGQALTALQPDSAVTAIRIAAAAVPAAMGPAAVRCGGAAGCGMCAGAGERHQRPRPSGCR